MGKHFNLGLKDLPPIVWMFLIGLGVMFIGRGFEINFLFWLGVIDISVTGVIIILVFLEGPR